VYLFFWSVLPAWPVHAVPVIKDLIVKESPWVDVRAFMDGLAGRPTQAAWNAAQTTTELSEVFAAAIASMTDSGGELRLPPGVLFIDNTVRISKHGIRIKGSPEYGTKVLFIPTADNVIAFDFYHDPVTGAQGTQRVGMEDVWIYSTDTSRGGKIGIRLYSVTSGHFTRVKVHPMNSIDNTSEALRLMGHDLTTFTECHFNGDIGMHIMNAPYWAESNYDLDHFVFRDTMFSAMNYTQTGPTPNPIILVDSPVIMSRVWFDGGNWNMGKHGFYWVSDSVNTSLHLKFNNIYREQNTDSDGWGMYIDAYVQNVTYENVNFAGSAGNGYYLRKVYSPTIINGFGGAASTIGYDIDNTVISFQTINTYLPQSQTLNRSADQVVVQSYGTRGSHPKNVFIDNNTPFIENNGVYWMRYKQESMDNNTSYQIPFFANQPELARVIVTAKAATVDTQLYICEFLYGRGGSTEVVRLVNDNTGVCAATNETGGTDGKISLDVAAGNFIVNLVNKIGATLTNVFITVEGML
jgi:hypothetical protein